MAANYFWVSPKFWPKARQRGWTDAQINLALYLLTCKHRNLEGLYELPKAYIASDLKWSPDKVEKTLAVLIDAGFAMYDEAAEMVLIPKALKHQSPKTDNQISGAVAQLKRIPRTCLWDGFRMACQCHCPKLADAIEREWPSQSDATSVGAHTPADADAFSTSISTSSPPQPPEQAQGEQDQNPSPRGERRANSRAHGTNLRALAAAAKSAAAETAQAEAASIVGPADDEQTAAWERIRGRLQASSAESTWGIYLEPLALAGQVDGTLVIDGPDQYWSWVNGKRKLIESCAEAEGVALRLASKEEHLGLRSVAA